MSVYVTTGRGRTAKRRIWNPGDPGSPTLADSKQELISFCRKPDFTSCPKAECSNTCSIYPSKQAKRAPFWCWSRKGICTRCENLYRQHGLELTELIALWEAQDCKCYRYPECSRMLVDPRIPVPRGQGKIVVDHDHTICPRAHHSCKLCRRGLACHLCNVQELSIVKRGMHLLPQGENLIRWLEFIGPEDRTRLKLALEFFPEER